MKEADARAGRLAGTIATRNDRRTKKGTPMAIISLSDASGGYEVIAFSEQVSQFSEVLQPGKSVVLDRKCVHCHRSLVSEIRNAGDVHGTGWNCVHCHVNVGHGPTR